MATPFRIKRSAVPGKRPALTDLQTGELALNTNDASLFAKRDTGGVGIGTTIALLTPWSENFGGQSIFYENSVGIGTTNPTSTLTVIGTGASISQLFVTGVSTFAGITTVTGPTLFSKQLNVSGVSTFTGLVDANGGAEIDNIRIGVANDNEIDTSTGNLTLDSAGGTVAIDDDVTISGSLNVTGLSTFAGITTVTGPTLFSKQLNVSGVSTFFNDVTLSGSNTDLVVDGTIRTPNLHSNGADLTIRGGGNTTNFPTIVLPNSSSSDLQILNHPSGTGNIVIETKNNGAVILKDGSVTRLETTNLGIDVTGHIETDTLNVSGVSTFAGITTVTGPTLFSKQLNVSGVSTFTGLVDANGGAEIDNIRIGIANDNEIDTSTGNLTIDSAGGTTTLDDNVSVSGTLGVTGPTTLSSTLAVTGVSTFTGNVNLSGELRGPAEFIIDPAAVGDNTGAVRIKGDLFVDGTQTIINSATIELADFIVGIASTATTDLLADGAGIKIGPDNTLLYDHTNTALKSSENLNLDSGKTYKINGTDVLSSTTLGSGVVNSSLTSVGTLTSLNVSGLSTFAGITTVTGDTLFTKQLSVSGVSTFVGIATFGDDVFISDQLFVNGIQITGGSVIGTDITTRNLSVSGISTFAGITTNTSTLFATQLSVAGVSTFAGITTNTSTLFANQLSVAGVSTHVGISTFQSTLFGTQLSVSGVSTFAGIVTNQSTIFGTQLSVSGISTFAGITTNTSTLFTNQLSVAGVSTHVGISTFQSTLFANQLSVAGVSTFAGITTNTSTLFTNQLSVSGVSTFAGITTNTSTLFTNQLSVSGVSTFAGITTNTSTLFTNQLSVAGVSTHVGISTFQSTLFTNQLSVAGVSTHVGISTFQSTLFTNQLSVAGVSTHVGISTFQSTLFTNQLSVAGVSTHVGISTFQSTLFTNQLSVAGVSTHVGISTFQSTLFTNQLSVAGVSTFAGITTVTGTTLFSKQLNVSGVSTISVNSSSDALRITQLGSGNALVVEDETNPDATPFVVNASGSVGIGTTNPLGRLQVGAAGTSVFVVTSTGGVGIGTTSPRVVLDTILNQDASTTIQVQNDTGGTSANASVVARNNLGFFSFQLNSSARTAIRLGSSIGGFAEIFTGSTFAGSGIKIGTTNALPVIIGTNNAEALRIDSSQRVGIGTTNPLFNLHVGNTLTGLYTGTTSKSFGIPEGTQFLIQDTGNDSTNNKFVGMGFAIEGPGGAIRSGYFGGITDASGQGLDLVIGRKVSNTTYSESIRIDGSGNVGIGTINPGARLQITPTSTGIAGLFSGTTSSDMVRITQLGSGNALVVEDETNPDATPFVVTGIGSVGIGTTNPQFKLQVEGDFEVGSGSTEVIRVVYSGTNIGDASTFFSGLRLGGDTEHFIGYGTTSAIPGVGGNLDTTLIQGRNTEIYAFDNVRIRSGTSDNIIFHAGTSSLERVRITSTGNVGIATTVIGARLHVVPSSTGIAGLFSGTTSADMVRITQLGSGNALVVEDSANPDATPFVVTATGNVGIGTTNPTSRLHVISTDPEVILVDRSSANNSLIQYRNTSGSMYAGLSNNATGWGVDSDNNLATNPHLLVLRDGGEVLVGSATSTGTASQKLQVTGGAYVSGNVGIGTTNPGARLQITPTSTGIAGLFSGTTSSDMVRITQLGSGNALVVEDETNPDATPFVVTATGNVGIGTTNPTSKLGVLASESNSFNTSAAPNSATSSVFIQNTLGDAVLFLGNDNQVSAGLGTLANNGAVINFGGKFKSSPTTENRGFGAIGAYKENNTSGNQQGYLSLYSRPSSGNLAERVRISSSGNVGIGTTNPTNALTVVGSGTSTSQLFVTGVSTFAGITTVTGPTLFAKQLNVSGVTTTSLLNVGVGGTIITSNNTPRVGINSTSPAYTLDVRGVINSSTDVRINGTSVLTSATNDAVALAIALG